MQDLLKYPKLNLYANAHAVNIMTYENNYAVYMHDASVSGWITDSIMFRQPYTECPSL